MKGLLLSLGLRSKAVAQLPESRPSGTLTGRMGELMVKTTELELWKSLPPQTSMGHPGELEPWKPTAGAGTGGSRVENSNVVPLAPEPEQGPLACQAQTSVIAGLRKQNSLWLSA